MSLPNQEPYIVDTSIVDGDPLSSIIVKETVSEEPVVEPVVEPIVESVATTTEPQKTTSEQEPSEKEGEGINTKEEVIPEETEEVAEEPNPFFYLGQQLKKEGFLQENFEISQEAQGHEIFDAYKNKLRGDLEPQIRQEVYAQLQNEGVNANDIIIAQAIRGGTDYRLLNEVTMHEKFGSFGSGVSQEEKVEAVRYMYISRGFSEKEILKNLQKDEESDEIIGLDDLFSDSQEFHKSKFTEFKVNQEKQYEQQQVLVRDQIKRSEDMIRNVLSSKKILDEPISDNQAKELREAIYSPTAVVEVEGIKYNTTELKKFLHEFDNSTELKLWLFKKYKFKGQDSEVIKAEVKKEVEDDFLNVYETEKKRLKKSGAIHVIRPEIIKEKPENKNGYMLDFTGPSVERTSL